MMHLSPGDPRFWALVIVGIVVVIGWFGRHDDVYGPEDRIHGTRVRRAGKLIEDPPGSGKYRPKSDHG